MFASFLRCVSSAGSRMNENMSRCPVMRADDPRRPANQIVLCGHVQSFFYLGFTRNQWM